RQHRVRNGWSRRSGVQRHSPCTGRTGGTKRPLQAESLRSRSLPPGRGRVGEGGRIGGGWVRSRGRAGPPPILPPVPTTPSQGGGTLRRSAGQPWNGILKGESPSR